MSDHLQVASVGAPAVVVVHDWYGQLPHVRGLVDQLAGAGFSALAVDLYGGRSTTEAEHAQHLMDELDGATARSVITEAVRTLRRSGVMAPRVSAIGFSMGGGLVLQMAKAGLFDAAVAYYAAADPTDAAMPCPILLHLAATDDFEPPDLPQQFVAAVNAAGGTAESHLYDGTHHSFANADVGFYAHAAAQSAWERTVAFLA